MEVVAGQVSSTPILSVTLTGDVPSEVRVPSLEGVSYSAFVVRRAVEDLYRTGLFDQVEAFIVEEPAGIRLRFHLTGKTRVTSLEVTGNQRISTSILTEALQLKSGSDFAQNLMEQDVERLRELYRRRGFFRVEVQGTVTLEGKSASVRYRIVEGPQALLGGLSLKGVGKGRESALREALRFPSGASFSQAELDKLLARAKAFYRAHGFLTCEIDEPTPSFDAMRNRVDVTLQVNEGKPVEILFEGNRHFDRETLLKNMTLESLTPFGFRKAISDLTQFYRKRGYFQVQIEFPQLVETDEVLRLTFPLVEGERKYIREVRIEGNAAFSDRTLRSKVKTHARGWLRGVPFLGAVFNEGIFDPLTFEEDKRLLEVFYRSAGYRSVKVFGDAHLENRRLVVTFRIQEGPRLLVRSVGIEGNTVLPTTLLLRLLSVKVGRPLDDEVVVGDRERLRAAYAAQGYPYCDVPSPDFNPQTGRVLYRVQEGRRVIVGALSVRFLNENPKTRPSVILREVNIKPGEPFNAQKLAESQQRIFRLGFFSMVRVEPVGIYEGREVVDIRVLVRERNAGSVNIGGGYSPSEGIRGTFEVVQRNLAGTGRRIGSKLRLGTLGNRYELTYVEPWTLGTPTRTTVRLFRDDLEEQDDTLAEGVLVNLSRTFFRFNQVTLQYRYQRFSLTSGRRVSELGVLPTLSGFGASFQRDTRDDLFNPRRGWFHEVGAEVSGGVLGGESEFFRILSETRAYRSLGGTVWATQFRWGYTSRWGSAREISPTERFRLGGSTTVRGYPERSLGTRDAYGNYRGDILFLASSELRIPMYRAMGLGIFVDAGNLWNSWEEVATHLPRVSAGVGLRVGTPLGPARFDVGYPLNRLRDLPRKPRYWIALGNVF